MSAAVRWSIFTSIHLVQACLVLFAGHFQLWGSGQEHLIDRLIDRSSDPLTDRLACRSDARPAGRLTHWPSAGPSIDRPAGGPNDRSALRRLTANENVCTALAGHGRDHVNLNHFHFIESHKSTFCTEYVNIKLFVWRKMNRLDWAVIGGAIDLYYYGQVGILRRPSLI